MIRLGRDDALARAYADSETPDAGLSDAALAAMARHEPFLLESIESPPQTNEVRRSAILIAAAHELVARTGLPMVLSELGTARA